MAKVGITCGGVWWPPEYFQAVEELGFDSIWTGEHIVFHRPILDAVPVLAGIAAVTKRIALGPAAILTPLRNPTMLAKELATLDIMSGGRLIVVAGVGGDFEKEFEAAGVPMAGRGRRTSETIEIMRKYWTEDRFSYAGTVFELDDVWLTPKPVQPGGPPIWLAGRSAPAIERAAVLGDGYMPYMYTAERCRSAFEEVREKAGALGVELSPRFVESAFVYVSMHDSPEQARELGIRDLSWRYGKDFTPWIDKYCVHGTPDTCIAQLREFVDVGIEHLALGMIHEESIALDPAPARSSIAGNARDDRAVRAGVAAGLAEPRRSVTTAVPSAEWAGLHERRPTEVTASEPGRTCTTDELADAAWAIAEQLRDRGVAPGDRVVVALPSSIRFVAVYLGIRLCGGVLVNLPWQWRREILQVVEETEARAVISTTGSIPRSLARWRASSS